MLISGQTGKIHFARVSGNDGLPQAHVFALGQDQDGFVWTCTMGGLGKYDGMRFTNYYHDRNDSGSISSNHAYYFFEDQSSRSWVATTNGLCLIDEDKGVFRQYLHAPNNPNSLGHKQVRAISELEDGRLILLHGKGVDFFDVEKGVFEHFLHPGFGYGRHTPCMYADPSGEVWAGSVNGLYHLKRGSSELVYYPLKDHDGSFVEVREICKDEGGTIWLGTNKGLYIFDEESATFEKVEVEGAPEEWHINAIVEHPRGHLYLGTGQGLFHWEIRSKRTIARHVYARDNPEGISGDVVYSLMLDQDKNLWIGLFNGINIINPDAERFQLFSIETGLENLANTVLEMRSDSRGRYWVNTMNGLVFWENLADKPKPVLFPPDYKHRYRAIRAMAEDKYGDMWFSITGEGLYKTELQSPEKIVQVQAPGYFKDGGLWRIIFDVKDPGLLWIATTRGLCRYKTDARDTTWYYPDKSHPDLRSKGIGPLAQDRFGMIWLINSGKLCRFDPVKNAWKVFKTDPDDPKAWYSGFCHNLVIAGDRIYLSGSSLSYFERSTETFTNFHSKNSIISNGVTSVQVAPNGKVWCAGGTSVYEFEPVTGSFRRFDTQNQAGGFITGSGSLDQNGILQFGSFSGVLQIDPDHVPVDSTQNRIVLSSVSILNQDRKLDQAPHHLKRIELKPEESVFTLNFTALSYFRPEKYRYKYQLEGFDPIPVDAGNRREVTYTNLAPGTYRFRAEAINSDGIGSVNPIDLEIRILPRFYQTWWFRVSIVLLLSVVIVFISISRRRTRKLLEEKRLAEQSASYKSRFLANMSHEIRTPMNAIVGLNKLLMASELDNDQKRYTEAIDLSCDSLLRIINDILDQAKIESGKLSIQSVPFEVRKVVDQVAILLNHKIREKGLVLLLEISKKVPQELLGDPTRLYQILVNLVGNAIKFTKEGSIEVKIDAGEEQADSIRLDFVIKDTGMGIAPKEQARIFGSFEQDIDTTNNQFYGNQGTGLGLSITRELVELQGGSIGLRSELGKGSEFYFHISFRRAIGTQPSISEREIRAFPAGLRILIVDDTPMNQFLAKEILNKHLKGPVIEIASNGREALEKLDSEEFDLILMDVKMPVMDGLEATRRIRSRSLDISELPIIGLTANAIQEQIDSCRKAGMNEVVLKPIHVEELLEKMNLCLGSDE